MDDVTVRYARSGGPGGQNVNKLVSRRHATKPFEIACTVVRPQRARTSIAPCGHAEYESGHAVQRHRGRLLARLGQGARSPSAPLASCGTLAKNDFAIGVELRGVGDLARPALRAH